MTAPEWLERYVTVAARTRAFRDDHPLWSLTVRDAELRDGTWRVWCDVADETGRVLSNDVGHRVRLDLAITAAKGRALAGLGYVAESDEDDERAAIVSGEDIAPEPAADPQLAAVAAVDRLRRDIVALGPFQRGKLKGWWVEHAIPPLGGIGEPVWITIEQLAAVRVAVEQLPPEPETPGAAPVEYVPPPEATPAERAAGRDALKVARKATSRARAKADT